MAIAQVSVKKPAFIIGVCGGSASGKSTVCQYIAEHLAGQDVTIVPADSFYRGLTEEERTQAVNEEFNFDSPNFIDFEELRASLSTLRNHQDCYIPMYDYTTHSRKSDMKLCKTGRVVIVEGVLLFSDPELRSLLDLKVFVDCDADVRLARRISRDISERGRVIDGVLKMYFKFVKPVYESFVEPSKRYADVIIPNAGSEGINLIAMEVFCKHIQAKLKP